MVSPCRINHGLPASPCPLRTGGEGERKIFGQASQRQLLRDPPRETVHFPRLAGITVEFEGAAGLDGAEAIPLSDAVDGAVNGGETRRGHER